MDFKTHIETAWKFTMQYIGPLLLITLLFFGVSIFSFGLLMPVCTAGYMQTILLMVRNGREPKMQDIFSQMNLFLPLLIFGIAVAVASTVGFAMFFVPGLLIVIALSFGCLYMLPLMTDKKMGIIEAIKKSVEMATRGVVSDHVIVLIIFMGISSIGSSLVIGALFTQPLATVFLMLVYDERIKQDIIQPPQTSQETIIAQK